MKIQKHEYSIKILKRKLEELEHKMLTMAEDYPESYKLNVRQRRNLEDTIEFLEDLKEIK